MIVNVVFMFLGIFIFLFFFWKRLKEDYLSSQIFTSAFYVVLAILLAKALSLRFFPNYWFWAALAATALAIAIGILRYHLRAFEALEAVGVGLLPWLGLTFLADFANNSASPSGLSALVVASLIVLFFFLDARYKSFAWYKSGRVGFAGLTVLGIFFLIRAAVAAFFTNMLSFMGPRESILSGTIAFVLFLTVFNLARQNP